VYFSVALNKVCCIYSYGDSYRLGSGYLHRTMARDQNINEGVFYTGGFSPIHLEVARMDQQWEILL